MGTWKPTTTKTPTLLGISWFWVFFKRIFDVNGCVGNKKSTIVDQNYYHQKGLTVSYKKHFYHFLIRRILFSISSFLCWEYARTPLENLTFIWSIFMKIYFQPHLMVFYTLSGKFKGHVSQCFFFSKSYNPFVRKELIVISC